VTAFGPHGGNARSAVTARQEASTACTLHYVLGTVVPVNRLEALDVHWRGGATSLVESIAAALGGDYHSPEQPDLTSSSGTLDPPEVWPHEAARVASALAELSVRCDDMDEDTFSDLLLLFANLRVCRITSSSLLVTEPLLPSGVVGFANDGAAGESREGGTLQTSTTATQAIVVAPSLQRLELCTHFHCASEGLRHLAVATPRLRTLCVTVASSVVADAVLGRRLASEIKDEYNEGDYLSRLVWPRLRWCRCHPDRISGVAPPAAGIRRDREAASNVASPWDRLEAAGILPLPKGR
jgi:hypothetical protein